MNNRNKYGLTDRDMITLHNILKKYPEVKAVTIFGSRAKGNYLHGSDIDLAIMNKGVSVEVTNKLNADFEESSLPFIVDLVNYTTLDHEGLIDHINRVGQVFFSERFYSVINN